MSDRHPLIPLTLPNRFLTPFAMARPQKNTVDYFPHLVDHGKTIFVLESQHGNDGYAFWFKLLEELGRHENHYFDLRDDAEMEYFASRARVSAAETEARLDLLARIGAIDAELWHHRIIWSGRFVENIADAYRKRKSGVPTRPRLTDAGTIALSGAVNPQSKSDESKPNKTSSAAGEDFEKFSNLLRAQFEALYRQAHGRDYTRLPNDGQALASAWEALRDKPDRVAWVATCLAHLFGRDAAQLPRSLSYCSRKLVEDYDGEHRKQAVETEMQTHPTLLRKLEDLIGDPAIVRRLFVKHGAGTLQATYDKLASGRHAYSYDVFRQKFYELLRQGGNSSPRS